jgi:hypothetical protein
LAASRHVSQIICLILKFSFEKKNSLRFNISLHEFVLFFLKTKKIAISENNIISVKRCQGNRVIPCNNKLKRNLER